VAEAAVQEVVFTAEQIAGRVEELGRQISADYAGQEIFLIAVLRGALPFLADLARQLTVPALVDFMVVDRSGSAVRIVKDLDLPLAGRDVLLVEDIVDEGETLDYLADAIHLRNPHTFKVVTMFHKPGRHRGRVRPDYCGFEVPERFVVGYGLDFQQRFRNLPYLALLERQ
jgi:hypoxanthine phosphoribosyltransferase